MSEDSNKTNKAGDLSRLHRISGNALVAVIVIAAGFLIGSQGFVKDLFTPDPQDIFFDALPEAINLVKEHPLVQNNDRTLALFYTEFGGNCEYMEAFGMLRNDPLPGTLVLLVVDSSFRPHDVKNLNTNHGIEFEVKVLPEEVSAKWRALHKEYVGFQGLALLFEEEGKTTRLDLGSVKNMKKFLNP